VSQKEQKKRIRERLALQLPARVHCVETPDFQWTEMTRLIDVTPFGAGFTLKRPTERGRLLHLTMPLPRQLRVFDHVEDQYKVWAIVIYVRTIDVPKSTATQFEVGVAFVGKRPPLSYEADPTQRYEIKKRFSADDSLTLSEQAEEHIQPIKPSEQQAHTRHSIPVEIRLETFGEKGEVVKTEETVTENISRTGARIFTAQETPIGRFVRFTSSEYNITLYAVVRNRTTGTDGIPRMHVEFIDREWPLD
jgi:hypothetical protein